MRSAPAALMLLAAFACGGRATLHDEHGEPEGEADGGATNGGASNGGTATNGGRRPSSGGAPTFGGAVSAGGAVSVGGRRPTLGGAPSNGGRRNSSGGRASSGGVPSTGGVAIDAGAAGAPAAGAGGDTGCFTAVQGSSDYCFRVELCTNVQREALCSLAEDGQTVICSCFIDGAVRSRRALSGLENPDLCALAIAYDCRGR